MRRAAVALLVATLAGCGAQRGGEPPRCAPPIDVPAGFQITAEFADAFPDRIATRSSLVDARGRELHRFAGLEGEFGEGLPLDSASVRLTGDGAARLLGSGTVWALVWRVEGPCGRRAVFGAGFRRAAFLRILAEVGLVRDNP